MRASNLNPLSSSILIHSELYFGGPRAVNKSGLLRTLGGRSLQTEVADDFTAQLIPSASISKDREDDFEIAICEREGHRMARIVKRPGIDCPVLSRDGGYIYLLRRRKVEAVHQQRH